MIRSPRISCSGRLPGIGMSAASRHPYPPRDRRALRANSPAAIRSVDPLPRSRDVVVPASLPFGRLPSRIDFGKLPSCGLLLNLSLVHRLRLGIAILGINYRHVLAELNPEPATARPVRSSAPRSMPGRGDAAGDHRQSSRRAPAGVARSVAGRFCAVRVSPSIGRIEFLAEVADQVAAAERARARAAPQARWRSGAASTAPWCGTLPVPASRYGRPAASRRGGGHGRRWSGR